MLSASTPTSTELAAGAAEVAAAAATTTEARPRAIKHTGLGCLP